MTDLSAAGTRRFYTIAEIEEYPGFVPENPLNLLNYKSLIGPITLRGEWVTCCVQTASGNLCRHPHLKGWVALLQDGSATILGGFCAKDKFGADSSVFRDIRRASNENKRLDNEDRLRKLLSDRDAKLAEVDVVLGDINTLRQRLADFRSAFGSIAFAAFEELARQGSAGEVVVQGVTPAERDKDGEIIRDGKTLPVPVGKLSGVRVCNPSLLPRVSDSLRGLKRHYEAATIEEVHTRKQRRLLTAALADHPRLIDDAVEVLADGEHFLANDFMPACFLFSDKVERYRLAKMVKQRAGEPVGSEGAKRWLQQLEAMLRSKHGVARITIPR